MKRILRAARRAAVLPVALLAAAALLAQDFRPPPGKAPAADTLKAIREKTTHLAKLTRALRKQGIGDALLADVDVYHQAAVAIVQHNEFFQPDAGKWTLEVLDAGLDRAEHMANFVAAILDGPGGKRPRLKGKADLPWLRSFGRTVVRGYRSRIDNSVQPFAVTLPKNYEAGKKWRVDVVLHGRDKGLTEVKFLHAHRGSKPAPDDQDFVRIDIYGRGNNAYRWAGEVDVIEAMEQFVSTERALRRDKFLDPRRWVLRGFSMGGAGTWHLGLHRPDAWGLLGPGAGFTATHGYVAKLPAQLPPWQEKCLTIYDAVDYAENVFDVPVVAYGGADDPQLQAARNIEARLKSLGLSVKLKVLVAPGLKHAFPPEWQQKAEEAYAPFVKKGRPEYPPRVRFVTWTLKYPSCDWVRILGLQRHYDKALVDAEKTEDGFKVKTENVRVLRLTAPQGVLQDLTVAIDGQQVTARPWGTAGGPGSVYLRRQGDRWAAVLPQRLITEGGRRPEKGPGLQGPIDDAFTDAFLCVRGTGTAWHEATQQYADANLRRFRAEWSKYWRGELPVKDDTDVTSEDITDKHLVLFGDPSSNSLIGHVLDGLPLQWTKETIALAGKQYPAALHVPVLIHPSPLNASRYVVLNTGHTFRAADYVGTNALLYPRLGDYAVLRLAATAQDPLGVEVATAGLFDEYWQIPKGGQ